MKLPISFVLLFALLAIAAALPTGKVPRKMRLKSHRAKVGDDGPCQKSFKGLEVTKKHTGTLGVCPKGAGTHAMGSGGGSFFVPAFCCTTQGETDNVPGCRRMLLPSRELFDETLKGTGISCAPDALRLKSLRAKMETGAGPCAEWLVENMFGCPESAKGSKCCNTSEVEGGVTTLGCRKMGAKGEIDPSVIFPANPENKGITITCDSAGTDAEIPE